MNEEMKRWLEEIERAQQITRRRQDNINDRLQIAQENKQVLNAILSLLVQAQKTDQIYLDMHDEYQDILTKEIQRIDEMRQAFQQLLDEEKHYSNHELFYKFQKRNDNMQEDLDHERQAVLQRQQLLESHKQILRLMPNHNTN